LRKARGKNLFREERAPHWHLVLKKREGGELPRGPAHTLSDNKEKSRSACMMSSLWELSGSSEAHRPEASKGEKREIALDGIAGGKKGQKVIGQSPYREAVDCSGFSLRLGGKGTLPRGKAASVKSTWSRGRKS